MKEQVLNNPIMYVTQYWGAPAFVKITPTGKSYDLCINDQHMALLAYRDKALLEDVEGKFADAEMIKEISKYIEAQKTLS